MAKLATKWLVIDLNSLENSGGNLQVKVVSAGAIERTTNGINIKSAGITDSMLAGNIAFAKLADADNIARLDQNETIVGKWDFPTGANVVTIGGKEVATQEYVDAIASGLDLKASVKALSTSNRTLSGLPSSVDGVSSWAAGDRVLLIAQTNALENGIWEVQTGAWTRPSDFVAGASAAGAFTFIEEGTINADSGWVCTSDKGSDIIDTDSLAFTQFSGAGTILAGNGLSKSGNTIFVVPAELKQGGNAEIDGDQIDIDYTPTAYTPNVNPAEVNDVDQLSAHLSGINDALSAVGQSKVDRITLTATDMTNKYVTLSAIPKAANRVTLKVRGAGSQSYSDDFVMDGTSTDRLKWDGLGLDGELESGDKLIIRYDI